MSTAVSLLKTDQASPMDKLVIPQTSLSTSFQQMSAIARRSC